MREPLVSILISVYNAGEYLRPSLESVLSQTYDNLEIILIDDGSTDGCLDTIYDIEDTRIKILRQENAGKSVALNNALEVISGDFYAIHDADDLSYPTRIERLVTAMDNNPEVAGVFSGYDLILNGKRVAPRFRYKGIEQCRRDIDNMQMPSHDPTAMFRTSMVAGFKYDPDLRIGQGWDYILRVGEKLPLVVIDECLYSYRCNINSNTRSNASRRQEKVALVLKRAYRRRCVDKCILQNTPANNSGHRDREYGIVPHFMESVLDLRYTGRYVLAIKTAVQCVKLHPMDILYYKPLTYSFLPLNIIKRYRESKYSKNILIGQEVINE